MRVIVSAFVLLAVLLGASRLASAQDSGAPRPSSPPRGSTQPIPSAGAFLGGVPSGRLVDGVITLTLLDAINRAIDSNLGVMLAEQQMGRASGTRWIALSHLLPNVSGRISETRQEISTQAFGFGGLGGFPTIIGPFNVFDARAYVSQSIVDVSAVNNARAEGHRLEAARHSYKGARDFVVWVASSLYLNALAADARAEAAVAQRQTAQALHAQAVDLRQGGIVAGIDVLRAEVALTAEIQRATVAANEAEKAKLQLARAIGLPLGQAFVLSPSLPELPEPDLTFEQALELAYATRADFRAAQERARGADAARRAVSAERLPALKLNADFGDLGQSIVDSHSTFSVSGAVEIPIFQGGRARGRLLEADADLRNRRAELEDMKAAIYYEIRTAFLDVRAIAEQLQAATKGRELAARQLEQARDRFAAGVASNIEVIQAQEAVAVANEQYISAKYGHDLARGALTRGVGSAEQTMRQVLERAR